MRTAQTRDLEPRVLLAWLFGSVSKDDLELVAVTDGAGFLLQMLLCKFLALFPRAGELSVSYFCFSRWSVEFSEGSFEFLDTRCQRGDGLLAHYRHLTISLAARTMRPGMAGARQVNTRIVVMMYSDVIDDVI